MRVVSLSCGVSQAAKGAFEVLAKEYAASAELQPGGGGGGEPRLFADAGARLVGVHWMHDTSPDALADSAGCTASFEFDDDDDDVGDVGGESSATPN